MPHTKDDAVLRTSSKSWHWLPLPQPKTQIRLIRFRPGSDDDEISTDIEIYDLDSAPPFNAISYTWGKEPPKSVVRIYDVPVFVRPNCHYALWQARQHFPDSYVWLDATCIDQSNLTEKGSQVAIMGDVYAKAVNVLACVGPADDCSDGIRDALADLDAAVQGPCDWTWALERWEPPQDEATTKRLLEQFNQFSDRPYFSRVWIVQELFGGIRDVTCVAILCGSYRMDWSLLTDLSTRLSMVFEIWPDVPWSAQWVHDRIYNLEKLFNLQDNPPTALKELLSNIDNFECDDARDRVFGTLRLIDWARIGKSPPVPDYEVSPFRFACYLMSLIDLPGLFDARRLVSVLDLGNFESSGLAEWLPTEGRNIMSTKDVHLHSKKRTLSINIKGAHLIRKDDNGRLCVALETNPVTTSTDESGFRVTEEFSLQHDCSKDSSPALIEQGLVRIFTGDCVSVIACNEASCGDILLLDRDLTLVLRAQDDGLSFDIVCPALVVNGYGPYRNDRRPDICWPESIDEEKKHENIELAIEVSNEDILAASASYKAVVSGKSNPLIYLKHHALGVLTRGAVLTDVTMAQDYIDKGRKIGPPKALCARHKDAERYSIARQALGYNAMIDGGDWVWMSN